MLRLGNGGAGCCFRVYTIFSAVFLTNGGKIESFDRIIVFWKNLLFGNKILWASPRRIDSPHGLVSKDSRGFKSWW